MTILRPYQKIIYEEIPRRLKLGPVLVQSPARSGKSKIISATSDRIQRANKISLVLTHRDKIKRQLVDHCQAIAIDATTDHIYIELGKCYVAMNQTLIKRPYILSQLEAAAGSLVILTDEAHRGDFNKTFDILPKALRIGFTATPAWKWAKFLPKYYKSLIHGPQVGSLIETGNVTPIEYYEMKSADLDQLKKGSNGEFTEQSNQFVFDNSKLYDGLFNELPKFAFSKCIIFCASKKSADLLTDQLTAHQYKATKYYSGIKQYELARFTELNECNVLVTVSALSEGFDHPPIDFNVLWRATTSLPLFIQMGMRGATPYAGKHKTTVLDFGGNNSRFGGRNNIMALTMDRDWNALWQSPEVLPKMSNGVAAIKNCNACDFILPALARSCSNCGYIYPVLEVMLKEGELVRIEHDLQAIRDQANSLTGRRISTLEPSELALYAKERDKKAFCMRVAKAKAVTNPDFAVDYGKAMGYSRGWVERILKDQAEIKLYEPDFKIEYHDILVK